MGSNPCTSSFSHFSIRLTTYWTSTRKNRLCLKFYARLACIYVSSFHGQTAPIMLVQTCYVMMDHALVRRELLCLDLGKLRLPAFRCRVCMPASPNLNPATTQQNKSGGLSPQKHTVRCIEYMQYTMDLKAFILKWNS